MAFNPPQISTAARASGSSAGCRPDWRTPPRVQPDAIAAMACLSSSVTAWPSRASSAAACGAGDAAADDDDANLFWCGQGASHVSRRYGYVIQLGVRVGILFDGEKCRL
jgi:hypothetical protein